MSVAHRNPVADAYQQAGPGFARAADPLIYRLLARPLVAVTKKVVGARPAPVLDVAAGAGAFGRAFSDVVALDISASQLAANGAPARVRGDAEQLPFRRDAFAVAGCAFGINHLLEPERAVREMARVAPVVAVSTWARPERPYAVKQAVLAALVRQVGRSRTAIGEMVDRLGDQVGSVGAVTELLTAAGMEARVSTVEVEVPWPGLDEYLDYRLSLPSTVRPADRLALRADVAEAIRTLPRESLTWRPLLVIGIGVRSRHAKLAGQ